MAAPKIMSGARAKVFLTKPGQPPQLVGIFSSLSYGVTYDVQPVYTLGAYAARELDYTAMEPVSISASGWRVIGQGPHRQALVPKLEELLRHEYLTLTVVDRQTGETIATIEQVRPSSYQTPIASRQLTEQSFSLMGILCSDESGAQSVNEDGTATNLP